MNLDLQSLSAEPLIYMLMHSGAFVVVLGIVFFLIGLLFGRATWGRYLRQTRELRGEAEAMKEEIADLKRKLADHTVKAAPIAPIVTETIQMPPRKEPVPAPAPPSFSPAEINIAEKNGQMAAANGIYTASALAQIQKSQANVIKAKAEAPADAAPASDPLPDKLPETEVPAAQATPATTAAKGSSPLAAIIGPAAPTPRKDPNFVPLDVTLPEIPLAAPAPAPSPAPAPVENIEIKQPDIKPEIDHELGLVYKSRPHDADDLTALKGIAQVLEGRLHALGVYKYEQIATWSQDQIREFSSRLAFKDRILREQWVEQARELLAKKNQPKPELLSQPMPVA